MSPPHTVPAARLGRAPKQDRSRASFERVLDAAARLMEERGYSGFSLSDVVARSRASIGSIYGRVGSKDELIRAAQQRVLARLELEQADMYARIRRRSLPLPGLITALIREMAGFLGRNAQILNAFMARAQADHAVHAFGERAYQHAQLDFKMLLIERRGELTVADADHAADVCFALMYSSLSHQFGVGRLPGNSESADLEALIKDLSAVLLAYLTASKRRRAR
jgi:AcrR family transcriptional regulator